MAAPIASKIYLPSGEAIMPLDSMPLNKRLSEGCQVVEVRGDEALVMTAWKEKAFV
jgi:hypothetical protein